MNPPPPPRLLYNQDLGSALLAGWGKLLSSKGQTLNTVVKIIVQFFPLLMHLFFFFHLSSIY